MTLTTAPRTAESNTVTVELERPETGSWHFRPGLTPNRPELDWRAEMDSTRRCSINGCDHTDIQARGWCRMHYFRWYRTGTTDCEKPKRQRRGVCSVDECENLDEGHHGLCPMHRTRQRRHGATDVVLTPSVHLGADHHAWAGDDVTYHGMHLRLRKTLGPAREYRCVDCGKPAAQWSYDNADPEERMTRWGPYSVDLAHYAPRCVPCHKRFDIRRRHASA